ncbi:MAG: Asp-tRNA(Asn)/Glu-tRNA(Gln) amidotransferase subunit GatC [Rhodospirillales bacterium]|nr:Asp-tRNA(Asn)/Glu-tRNA(Gln) amidotransferase subunit GatC [Rhodospirillales bacterium]MCW8971178.1 Asp-tRNA(Asn)/Glu-tRNA(Gln) amidotransferase subunit GatC [Rhodospirillales bacterium]MCW9003021.1 Asp-tRNA(Asn)/Glu-tRNA(Gln) amidotransferase subunit GatC [Rhodospirillales bacterium]MCW9040621.1 Asp-tRNA(Asn)/Glu-tRNA(Gln) amidotransferase subunit GatC [Rhodospirillales bacterium]
MSLDKQTVERIAFLARIRIPEGEVDALAGELSQIIDWVEQLEAVDTDGVAPMSSVVDVALPLRDDAVASGGIREKVMANAPEAENGFFLVPKVVE